MPPGNDQVTLPDGYSLRFATPADADIVQAQREAMFIDMGADGQKLRLVHAASLDWHRRMVLTLAC